MYKIVIDSCGELPENLKSDSHFCNVPLELEVDGFHIRDDKTFDQLDFLKKVKESPTGPKSACPSPDPEGLNCPKSDAPSWFRRGCSGCQSGLG